MQPISTRADNAGDHVELSAYQGRRGSDASDEENEPMRGLVSRPTAKQPAGVHGESSGSTFHWRVRLEAFALSCALGFGSHFAWHLLGPLKEPIKQDLGISNTGFGALQSSLSVLATVTPVLGGMLVDRVGCDEAALLSTSTVLVGLVVLMLSMAFGGFYGSLFGLAMIGVGSNWVTTAQDAAMVRVYPEARGRRHRPAPQPLDPSLGPGKRREHRSEVALMFGLLFSIGKLFSFLSNGVALHLYESLHSVVRVFAVGLLIALGSVLAAMIQWRRRWRWARYVDPAVTAETLRLARIQSAWWDGVGILSPEVRCYLVLEFLLGACWQPFLHLSSNMIKVLYNIEAKHAAWLASITVAIPIVMNPLVGMFLDRTQRRTWAMMAGTMFLLLAFSSMLYSHRDGFASALPPLLVSFSISFTPLAMVTVAPRLVPANRFGLLLGLHRCLENTGAVWVGSIAGPVQDFSLRNGHEDDGTEGYIGVVRLFVLLGLGAFTAACVV
ncbi:major facilitator superfamily domain-containing protein, partial [Thamnocephalis sphaerospora]